MDNTDIKIFCTTTGEETDVVIWFKEVAWKSYWGMPRKFTNGSYEIQAWDFKDVGDVTDTLNTEFECRSCARDNVREDHFRFQDAGQPVALTHGGSL